MHWIAVPTCALIFAIATQAHARDPLLDHFEGTWGLAGSIESCRDEPATLEFSADGSELKLSYPIPLPDAAGVPRSEYTSRVTGVAGNSVRMIGTTETRRDADGNLVVWDLVLKSKDVFCWHRADWEPGVCSAPRFRCKSVIDDFERRRTRTTEAALELLQQSDFRAAAELFGMPDALPSDERVDEYTRLANSLRVILGETGPPREWAVYMQRMDHKTPAPEIVNLSLGPSHVLVSQEHDNYFYSFFEVVFEAEGEGYFRAAFDTSGKIMQMTFSLPRERSARMSQIGEILLRETAHEF